MTKKFLQKCKKIPCENIRFKFPGCDGTGDWRCRTFSSIGIHQLLITVLGASVAQWSVRSPFTSEVAALWVRFSARTFSTECRGFSPGTPVFSHREVDRVG